MTMDSTSSCISSDNNCSFVSIFWVLVDSKVILLKEDRILDNSADVKIPILFSIRQ